MRVRLRFKKMFAPQAKMHGTRCTAKITANIVHLVVGEHTIAITTVHRCTDVRIDTMETVSGLIISIFFQSHCSRLFN